MNHHHQLCVKYLSSTYFSNTLSLTRIHLYKCMRITHHFQHHLCTYLKLYVPTTLYLSMEYGMTTWIINSHWFTWRMVYKTICSCVIEIDYLSIQKQSLIGNQSLAYLHSQSFRFNRRMCPIIISTFYITFLRKYVIYSNFSRYL